VGGFEGAALAGPWSRAARADLDPPATADGVTQFYFRLAQPRSGLRLPIVAGGELTLTLRGSATVRHALGVHLGNERVGELLVETAPWSRREVVVPERTARGRPIDLSFSMRPLPLVAGDHGGRPSLRVDHVELASPGGLRLAPSACAVVGIVPLLALGFALAVGSRRPGAIALAAAVAAVVSVRAAPLETVNAIPRLLPLALIAALAAQRAMAWARLDPEARGRLAWLVLIGTLAHGALPFFPNHQPPDLGTHVVRTFDFRDVPLTYSALLEYGSHLPTASQKEAPATELFGGRALVPYSPLPYFVFYLLHLLGLDPRWAMSALTAALAMSLAPLVWATARHVWGVPAAWTAALLYALDLPLWHHLGRAHTPAVFGNGLGVAALLLLALAGHRTETRGRCLGFAGALGLGALGYTSVALLLGLFGLVLLALFAIDARELSARSRLLCGCALAGGGLLAGVLYYFHYVPGLVGGGGGLESAAPEVFDPQRFLFLTNESRQSVRIWRLGSWWLFAAGLAAAPFALARARGTARPFLTAWLAAWALVVVLKAPVFFPKLLRWTKEEQFVSPLLDLLVGAAVGLLPRAWMRWAAGILAVAWALRLQLRDYLLHADSLAL